MSELSTIADLGDVLCEIKAKGLVLVGLDGMDGAGKTAIAHEVAVLTGWRVIHLDDYLVPDQGTFVDNLRYGDIKLEIESTNAPVLVEGVCLLDVADKIGISIAAPIYVKRVNAHGFWADEGECEFAMPADQKISELEDQTKQLIGDEFDGLTDFRKEIIRYHARWNPSQIADRVFKRGELPNALTP